MLVVTRFEGERIFIDGDRIKVMLVQVRGDKARIGVEAGQGVSIHREEVWARIQQEKTKGVDDGKCDEEC